MVTEKEVENVNYIDITKNFAKNNKSNSHKILDKNYFKDSKGFKYKVDGKNVVLDYSKKEKDIAIWLEKTFAQILLCSGHSFSACADRSGRAVLSCRQPSL